MCSSHRLPAIKPIGSQQVQVAWQDRKLDDVGVHLVLGPHRSGNDIAHGRRSPPAPWVNCPKRTWLIHQRMVMGQALQGCHPACDKRGCRLHEQSRHGRPRVAMATSVVPIPGTGRDSCSRTAVHTVVGRVDRMLETFPGSAPFGPWARNMASTSHAAGDFTRSRATHAVRKPTKLQLPSWLRSFSPYESSLLFRVRPLVGRTGCLVFQHSLLFCLGICSSCEAHRG